MQRTGVKIARCFGLAVALIAMLCVLTPTFSQQAVNNEREVKPQVSELDKGADVWAMEVRFKDPRMIKVKLPTRGERICWYMWYQLINRSDKPQLILPAFELVTLDTPGLYQDEILITAEEKIKKLEDPTGYQDIKNTVLMGKFAIPVSKPPDEAFPRAYHGSRHLGRWPCRPEVARSQGKDAHGLRRASASSSAA